MPVISGDTAPGNPNDSLAGTAGNDTIEGLSANDTLSGGLGSDLLVGSIGDDVVVGGGGADTIIGGEGDDSIGYLGDAGAGGTAPIVANLGATAYSTSVGGIGVTVQGGTVRDGFGQVDVVSQVESIGGTGLGDTLIGAAGDDFLGGGDGADSLSGGTGFDILAPGAGDDTVRGGLAFDEVYYADAMGPNGVVVDLSAKQVDGSVLVTDPWGDTDVLYEIERIRGTNYADTLIGDSADNRFRGMAGADSIDGGAGIDRVDYLREGTGPAGVIVNLGGLGAVSIDGVGPNQARDPSGALDSLLGIEQVFGTRNADHVVGSGGDDLLRGNGGNDTLEGGSGNDVVSYVLPVGTGGTLGLRLGLGGRFVVELSAGGVAKSLYVIEMDVDGFVRVTDVGSPNADGSDLVRAEVIRFGIDPGDQGISGTSIDFNVAQRFGTVGTPSALGDSLVGGASNDVLNGGAGDDTLVGGPGDDGLAGGGGNDRLDGTDPLEGVGAIDTAIYQPTGTTSAPVHGVIVNLAATPTANTILDDGSSVAAGTAFDTTNGTDTLIDIESLAGTNASDTLIGASANNAFGFDRTYFGLGGDDSIAGGTGIVIGAAAYASVWLDQVHYNADADFGGTEGVIVNLGSAPVTASIASGTFTVEPNQARDGFGNTDTLSGIEGVVATGRDDYLVGSDQNDRFRPLRGQDTVIGGPGFDQVDYLRDVNGGGSQGIWVNLGSLPFTLLGTTFGPSSAKDGFGSVDSLDGIESVRSTDARDTLVGSSGADLFLGQGGDDWLFGDAGDDTLDGGAGFVDRADYQFETGSLGVLVNLTGASQSLGGQTIAAGTARDSYGNTDTLIGIEEVTGTSHDDAVATAATLNQSYRLRGGNDIFVNLGAAWVVGEGGNDTIIGQATGSYTVAWFQYNSEIRSGLQGITVDLSAGTAQDSIAASLPGSQGNDVLQNVDEINATTGEDLLIGSTGRVEAFAGWAGNDTIIGSSDAADRVNYERDVFYLGATGQPLATNGIVANLTGSAVNGLFVGSLPAFTVKDGFDDFDTLQNIYSVWGTSFDDVIVGGARPASPNSIPLGSFGYGRDGDDTFIGSVGSDAFFGEGGHDLFQFAPIVPTAGETRGVFVNLGSVARTDTFAGQTRTVNAGYGHDQFGAIDLLVGVEEVIGSSLADLFYGADTTLTPNPARPEGIFNVFMGLDGADTFVGGSTVVNGITVQSGFDAVSYVWDAAFGATQGVTVDLGNPDGDGTAVDGFGATDVLRNIDGLGGSVFADLLIGNATRSTSFMGYGGADTFVGGSAIDSLYYGDEDVGPQGVLVNLGTGTQTLSDGTITLAGGTARDGLGFIDQLGDMTSGTVTVLIENVYGTDFKDSLFGSAADNLLWGGAGNDQLIGGDGADTLDGGAGNDWADMGRQGQGVGTIVNLGASTVRFDIGTAGGLIAVESLRTYDNYGKTDVLAGIENVRGTNSADAMVGSDGANTFDARNGHDTMVGGANADIFLGGRGNDLVDGRASVNDPDDTDLVWFQDNFDAARTVPVGTDDAPGVVVNLTDVDIATAWSLGNPGAGAWTGPQVTAHSAADLLADGDASGLDQGRDVLLDVEEVRGTTGADTLVGGDTGNDDYEGFAGLAGDDVIVGGTGFDRVFFTSDDDVLALPGHGGVVVNLSASAITATVQVPGTTNPASATVQTVTIDGGHALDGFGDIDTLVGIESAFGTRYGDMIVGGNGDEQINGLAGNDTLAGGGGFDEVRFDNGNPTGAIVVDLLAGTATDGFGGHDSLSGFEMVRGTLFNDSIKGGTADERFRALGGSDTIDGGGGSDTVDYSRDNTRGGNAGVQVLLGIGAAFDGFGAKDTLLSIENARGTGSADTLLGNGADNRLEGLAGDDTLGVGGGNDSVDGGEGFDTAEFAFDFDAYTGTLLAGGAYRLEDNTPGRDGIITASNVEVFSFADRTLTAAQLTAALTNSAPTGVAVESATTSVVENTDTGAAPVLGTLIVTDDGRGTNALSLGGADAAFFEIAGSQLRLKAGTVLDFETKSSYAVTISVDDPTVGGSPDASTAYTLGVTDVNEAPTAVGLDNLTTSLAENTSTVNGVALATVSVVDDALGSNVLSLSGSDASFFEIVAGQLRLKAGTLLDAAAKASYAVTLNVDDAGVGGTPDASTTYGLAITGVNDAPTGVSVSATTSIQENTATVARQLLGTITVDDDGVGTNLISLGGADAALFEVDNGQLFLKAGTVLDFETLSSYAVTVSVDDPAVGTAPDASTNYTLFVGNVNEAPTTVQLSSSVAENQAGVLVGTLAASDPDTGDTFAFSVSDSRFEVRNGNELWLKAGQSLDFEQAASLQLPVTATDAGGLSVTQAVTVSVTNVNEAPTSVSLGSATTSIAETASTANAVALANLSVADDALGTNVLSVTGADAAFFEIVGGQLRLKAGTALNFETKSSYTVTVGVDDASVGGTPDASASYTLTVTDVNEAPTAIATTNTVASLAAGTGMGSAVRVADLVVTDDGLGTNVFGLAGADAASFEVVGSSLFLKAGTVLDAAVKPAYAVTVTVDDATTGGSPDAAVAFNLAVAGGNAGAIAINNAPVIVSNGGGATGALPILSGTTAVTTVHATDGDAGTTLVYSLAGGADQGLFQIDPFAGVLSFVAAPDFATPADVGGNNVYDVVVRVSDGALVDEQAIAVTVDPAQGLVPGIGGQAGFGTDALPRNDDSVTSQLAIGSVFENGLNFFGNVFSALFISNNGRVTFNSADGSFTPQAITGATNNAQIGVFFADVDTRGGATAASPGGQSAGSNLVYYALDVPNDRIVITWDDVGYYSNHVDKVNSFQLILTDRSSTGQAGDFDITFRYEAINWTTGDASQGSNGFGGIVARAGYSAGTGVAGTYFELPTSGNQQAMLDLDADAGNTGLAGIWEFQVRNGVVDAPPSLALGNATATLVEATVYDAGTDTSSIALTIVDDNDLGSYVTTGWTQLTATTFRKVGIYGAAVLDTVANTVTYTLDNADPDTDALATGTTAHDLFSLSVTDGFSTVSRDIDFAIIGRNESLASGPAPGTTGDDTLSGIGGDFSLAGVAGNDSYIVDSAGDEVIEAAGNGSDTVFVRTVASYAMTGNVEVAVLQSGTAAIVDNGADNSIFGNGLDNDVTLSQGGDDTVVAGGGNDTVSAIAGSNALFGNEGADSLLGGAGDDRLIGGTGDDVALGSGGNDTLWGEDGADSLSGDDGNDVIVGGTGDDTMDGGAGNDSYDVDSLFDLIMPDSEGIDTVHVSYDGFVLDAARGDLEVIVFETGVVTGSGNDFSNTLFGNAGANTLLAGGGNDTVVAGEGGDSASGGDDQDQLFGQGGNDTLDAGDGFDQLIGGTGDDRLVGGAGADTLWGEDGNDSLEGGAGDDHLLGGAGQDLFIISIGGGVDTIYDYNAAQDTIDVLAPAGSWSVVAGGGFYSVLDSGGTIFLQVVGSDPPLLT